MQTNAPETTPAEDLETPLDPTTETDLETPAETDLETSEETDVESKGKAAREAARYRTRLRETEAERDTLAHTLEAVQRQFVEHIIADRFEVAADLFDVSGTRIADLLDDAGVIDLAKVDAAARDALNRRPGLRKAVWPDMGQGRQASIQVPDGKWSEFLSSNPTAR